jgi:hypothetical protein
VTAFFVVDRDAQSFPQLLRLFDFRLRQVMNLMRFQTPRICFLVLAFLILGFELLAQSVDLDFNVIFVYSALGLAIFKRCAM